MLELTHPYISVYENSAASYGGSQMNSKNGTIVKCGCGPVAALDLLIYLDKYHFGCKVERFVNVSCNCETQNGDYQWLLSRLIRRYLPIIPRFGMNGLTLMSGINLFFRRHNMPFKARWGVAEKNTFSTIEQMLKADIPVIMAIGPNFPLFWQKHKAALYTRAQDGKLFKSAEVNAHYITCTGIDDEWLQVSSWGRKYYLNRAEFSTYVRQHSINYISSILYVKRI